MTRIEAQQILAWHNSGQSPASIAAFSELIKYRCATDPALASISMDKKGAHLVRQAKKLLGIVNQRKDTP